MVTVQIKRTYIRLNVWNVVTFVILVGLGCSDDSEPTDGALLQACQPEKSDSCNEGLVCVSNDDGKYLCHVPPGGQCDSEAEDPGCSPGAKCVEGENPGTEDGGVGDSICLIAEGGECDVEEPYCMTELTCAELDSGEHRCFAKVLFVGTVTDAMTQNAIGDAHVIGLDQEGVAVTDIAESDSNGDYTLEIPAIRDKDGAPLDATYTLRSAAQDYQAFPSGLRTALPIDLSEVVQKDSAWVIEGTLTDIVLIPLPDDSTERFIISGQVQGSVSDKDGGTPLSDEVSGVLVVASSASGAFSAISDRNGNFTIFNVIDGSYDIMGYAADVQLSKVTVQVQNGDLTDVSLEPSDDPLSDVSGNIQIVNAPGGAETSVILVVESTFDEDFVRGEVPRGLRAPRTGEPNVVGYFTIEGVPNGNYVVLAAYENDDLVRDPDTNIAGTDLVHIQVKGGEVVLDDSFKVTEALEIIAPGAEDPESVNQKPTLRWADDSSEDWYEVRVFNAYGDEVWKDLDVPAVSGSAEVTLKYEGPLEPGMYYQFRVTSWRQSGKGAAAPISATEDLRGVFFAAH